MIATNYIPQISNPKIPMATSQSHVDGSQKGDFAATMRESGVESASQDAQDGPRESDVHDHDGQCGTSVDTRKPEKDMRGTSVDIASVEDAPNASQMRHAGEKTIAVKIPTHDAGKSLAVAVKGAKHTSAAIRKEPVNATIGDEGLGDEVATDGAGTKNIVAAPAQVSVVSVGSPTSHSEAKTSSSVAQASLNSAADAGSTSGNQVAGQANVAIEAVDAKGVDASALSAIASVAEAKNTVVQTPAAGAGNQIVGQVVDSRSAVGIASSTMSSRLSQASMPVRDGSAELALQSYEAPSPNQLEVGLSGGSYGWLKVRAELTSGGELHAYLRGGSTNAEETLRSQSQQMASYLSSQEVRMTGVHVESSRSGIGGFSGGGAERQGQQESSRNGSHSGKNNVPRSGIDTTEWQSDSSMPLMAILGQSLSGTGGWLSVRV